MNYKSYDTVKIFKFSKIKHKENVVLVKTKKKIKKKRDKYINIHLSFILI